MANGSAASPEPVSGWRPQQVYVMAAVCLLLGIGLGYLFRGSETATAARSANSAQNSSPSPDAESAQGMPTLEQMKQMADKKAGPLLEKLKADPKNPELLIQTGRVYEATHQFRKAAGYLEKAVEADPKNIGIRTEMASCLYYSGDPDGAIRALEQTLHDQPADANSLFNLGLIRWQGKNDAPGAISAWEQLLKTNPKLESNKKSQVQKLIADARQHGKLTGAKNPNEEH